MNTELWIIDAFTPVAFKGNPAGVCLLDSFPDDAVMQLTAAQVNLSETAFLVQKGPKHYQLRWFTPETEVKLCGHATLAATHVLNKMGHLAVGDTVRYETLSGELTARVLSKSIELDFPNQPGETVKPPAALNALGVDIKACEFNGVNYLVEVKNYEALLSCLPNFRKLEKANGQGVIVTTAKGVPEGFDFASRYFAPKVGVNEDMVCGSAHCFLAPYWAAKLNKTTFHAYQASKGQGVLDVTLKGDRVLIAGQCVTSLKGLPLTFTPVRKKEYSA